jgi:hypothetical protein
LLFEPILVVLACCVLGSRWQAPKVRWTTRSSTGCVLLYCEERQKECVFFTLVSGAALWWCLAPSQLVL